MNPQVVKAEAQGNRSRMLRLAEMESKFGFIFIAIIGVPLFFEMESILNIWLGTVPEYAVFFCRMVLLASIADNLTYGLVTANQAIGNIRNFSIVINGIKLLALPASILLMEFGFLIHTVMFAYVLFELASAIIRIPMMKKDAGLCVSNFVNNVFAKEAITILVIISTSCFCSTYVEIPFRFLLTISLTIVMGVMVAYKTALCEDELNIIKNILSSIVAQFVK